tara:strand:+ start:3333 stop:3461 length:129 start_codon:yes stop_codon:yes gene_type:complete
MRKRIKEAAYTGVTLTAWSAVSAAILLHILYYNILFDEKRPF